jgi:hypothetical protein
VCTMWLEIEQLRLQSLICPVTDYGRAGDSYDKYASGYGILTRKRWFKRAFAHV